MKQYIQFSDYDDEFSAIEKLNKFIASEKNKNVTVEGYQQVKYEQTNNERTYILVSYEEVTQKLLTNISGETKEDTTHGN